MKEYVNIIVDGHPLRVPAGISVASAVLGHGHGEAFHKNSMDGSARAPYCLMGVCFECMMEIDGRENVQSCLVAVAEGLRVNRQMHTEPFTYSVHEDFVCDGVEDA